MSTSDESALEVEASAAEPALVPVLGDLRSQRVPPLRLTRSDDPEVAVWLLDDTGTGAGVPHLSAVEAASETREQAVVRVANLVQDAAVEALASAGLPAVWPVCPLHPNHPLTAVVLDTTPVWRCPTTGGVIAVIGGLDASPAGEEPAR